MASINCKSWKGVKVEIKKKYCWNCCLKPSQGFGLQIEPQPTRWQYHLINYPAEDDETIMDSNPRPQQKQGGCDLSFLRFDPQSNRMTLESSATSSEKPAKFPLEILTPSQSPNIGHRLRRMGSSPGSWRFDFFWFPFLYFSFSLYVFFPLCGLYSTK